MRNKLFKNLTVDMLPNPSNGEILIVHYDYGEIEIRKIKKVLSFLHKEFPNNSVIAIPSFMSLNMLDKSRLYEFRDNLSKAIDELISAKKD